MTTGKGVKNDPKNGRFLPIFRPPLKNGQKWPKMAPQAKNGPGGGRGSPAGSKMASGGRGTNVKKLSHAPITH